MFNSYFRFHATQKACDMGIWERWRERVQLVGDCILPPFFTHLANNDSLSSWHVIHLAVLHVIHLTQFHMLGWQHLVLSSLCGTTGHIHTPAVCPNTLQHVSPSFHSYMHVELPNISLFVPCYGSEGMVASAILLPVATPASSLIAASLLHVKILANSCSF